MSDFRTYLNEQLKNPDFKAEYDALESEYQPLPLAAPNTVPGQGVEAEGDTAGHPGEGCDVFRGEWSLRKKRRIR